MSSSSAARAAPVGSRVRAPILENLSKKALLLDLVILLLIVNCYGSCPFIERYRKWNLKDSFDIKKLLGRNKFPQRVRQDKTVNNRDFESAIVSIQNPGEAERSRPSFS